MSWIVLLNKGTVNFTIIEKYDKNIIVDKIIRGSDIFINGKNCRWF